MSAVGAEAIKARREALGLTVKQACALAGMTPPTWSDLEKGRKLRPQQQTLDKVDTVLQWGQGTTASVLASTRLEGAVDVVVVLSELQRSVEGLCEVVAGLQHEVNLLGRKVQMSCDGQSYLGTKLRDIEGRLEQLRQPVVYQPRTVPPRTVPPVEEGTILPNGKPVKRARHDPNR